MASASDTCLESVSGGTDLLETIADLAHGLTVEFDRALPEYALDLMEMLGVTVVYRKPKVAPTR